MRQIRDSGVTVVGIEWGGLKGANLLPHITVINTPKVVEVLAEQEFSALRYVILYDSAIALRSERPDFADAPTRADFFADMTAIKPQVLGAGNLRRNNKPVVYFYISRAYQGNNIAAVFQQVRTILSDANTTDLYVVADELYWTGFNPQRLVDMGASAATSFHGMDPAPDGIVHPYRTSNDYAARPMKAIADSTAEKVYKNGRESILATAARVNIHPGVWPQYSDRGTQDDDGISTNDGATDPNRGVCWNISRPPNRVLTEELKPATGVADWT